MLRNPKDPPWPRALPNALLQPAAMNLLEAALGHPWFSEFTCNN